MARRKPRQTADDRNAPTPHPLLRVALLTMTGAGVVLTAYLGHTALTETLPAYCGEDSGCDLVQRSRWATFLGIPTALWGMLTYLVMAGLSWQSGTRPGRAAALVFVAVAGFAVSAYLTVISVAVIRATCGYCLASFGLITVIMILAFAQCLPDRAAALTSFKEAALVAALLVVGLHLHYSGVFDDAAGPEDPQLRALAIHLTETGAAFYGAHWCPSCRKQKAMFKASARRLPYVECSSGGRGSPLTAPCAANDIREYPTWIIGTQRRTGIRTPRALAGDSGFVWK